VGYPESPFGGAAQALRGRSIAPSINLTQVPLADGKEMKMKVNLKKNC